MWKSKGENNTKAILDWQKVREIRHGDDGNVYTLERGPERYIHLEKPANMSIGESLYEFYNWYDDKRDASIAGEANGIGEALEHLEVMSDETFLKLWQEWLNTFPLSDRKSTDNNVGNCGIKNCKLSSVHAHVLYL